MKLHWKWKDVWEVFVGRVGEEGRDDNHDKEANVSVGLQDIVRIEK